MLETLNNTLDSTSVIQKAMPQIIEAFVTFYGEEQREEIVQKFKNMLIIGYSSPENLEHTLLRIRKCIFQQHVDNLFDQLGIVSEKREENQKILFDGHYFEFIKLMPLHRYIQFKTLDKEQIGYSNKKKETVNFLKHFYPEVTMENYDELASQNHFQEIDGLIPHFQQMYVDYQNNTAYLAPYDAYVSRCKELEDKLNKKYWYQLVEDFQHLFPLSEVDKVNRAFQLGNTLSSKDIPVISAYVSTTLRHIPYLTSFDEKHEEILRCNVEWKKRSVMDDRVSFFRRIGIDLGKDYQSYVDAPNAEEFFPSIDIVTQILNRKKELENLKRNEYYHSLEEFKQNRALISESGFLIDDDSYNAWAYHNNSTHVTPNLINQDGSLETAALLCFNTQGLSMEFLDKAVVHELNHVKEQTFLDIQGDICHFISGWDFLRADLTTEREEVYDLDVDRSKRRYELFSEIINEVIAQDITKILHQNNCYLFNTPENARIVGGTSYQHTLFLVKEFYQTYKKEILQSRRNGDLQVLFDRVGKDNFEQLNELFHEFLGNFDKFSYGSLMGELAKNMVTPRTEKYHELVNKRDAVLVSMKEHALSHNETRGITSK